MEAGDPQPGKPGRVNSFYSEGAIAIQLMINELTGEVVISDMVAIFDVGKAINPKLVNEQIIGAISMGIAGALYEKVIYDEKSGRTINANYSDYKIPTIHEHPLNIEVIVLEEPVKDGPYGAKGIGEVPIVAIAPAIANAIHDAIGNRIRTIPMTPEDIWKSMRSNGQ